MDKTIYTSEYSQLLQLLRSKRIELEINQADLAEKLGVNQSSYSKLERGERRIDVIQLRTILTEMGISLVEFIEQLEASLAKPAKSKKRSCRK